MDNQLVERLVLGGFSYKEAFPFSGVAEMSSEKVLSGFKKVLNEEALSIASKILDEKGYDSYLKAIGVAEKRFLFYKNLLASEKSRVEHSEILGGDDFILRIVFAMHGCIEHANKILCHMRKLTDETLLDSFSAMKTGYNLWTILNQEEPITMCQMTGVCICRQGDAEPYIDGCVMSDPTKIMISKGEHEKILADDMEIRVARRLEKNNK